MTIISWYQSQLGVWHRPEMKRGSSVVRHLPLVVEVPGSISARSEENFGVQKR